MDTRGDLLFVLVLISSGLVSGNQWILGGAGRSEMQVKARCRAGAGQGQGRGRRHGVDPWSFAYFNKNLDLLK